MAVVKLEPHLFSNLPILQALLPALLAPFQAVPGTANAATIGIEDICNPTKSRWTRFSQSELLRSVIDRAREDLLQLAAAAET